MSIKSFLKIIELAQEISKGNSGGPSKLSKRLGISKTTLYSLKEELELLGAKIKFDKKDNTLYYTEEIEIELIVKQKRTGKTLNQYEIRKIVGGAQKIIPESIFLTSPTHTFAIAAYK